MPWIDLRYTAAFFLLGKAAATLIVVPQNLQPNAPSIVQPLKSVAVLELAPGKVETNARQEPADKRMKF